MTDEVTVRWPWSVPACARVGSSRARARAVLLAEYTVCAPRALADGHGLDQRRGMRGGWLLGSSLVVGPRLPLVTAHHTKPKRKFCHAPLSSWATAPARLDVWSVA